MQLDEEELGPRDVVVSCAACGVCGSDVASFLHGHYTRSGQVLGHEVVGPVTQVGTQVEGVGVGDLVAIRTARSCGSCTYCRRAQPYLCDQSAALSIGYGVPGGLAEQLRVTDAVVGVDLFPVPQTVTVDDLVWAEPLAVAIHALARARLQPSDRLLIVGGGSTGLCLLAASRAQSAGEVTVVEPRADRRAAAESLGARALPPEEVGTLGTVDVVIDTSGSPTAIGSALALLGPGGRLVLLGLSDRPIPWPTAGIDVLPSFAYGIEHFAQAVDHIAHGRVRLGTFVSHRFSLLDADRAISMSATEPNVVKAVVYPNGIPNSSTLGGFDGGRPALKELRE
ncbi:MAG: zinc-dependent alcohol dehydrogenase [Blastococcus sp.]